MPPHPHCHWRGVKEWRDLGLPMSTTSDEACKMFDAAFTQVVNHYDDDTMGGVAGCMGKMLEADPDFIMGHVMQLGFSGKKIRADPDYAQQVYKLVQQAQKPHVTSWERRHVNALKLMAEGSLYKAVDIWEDMLVEYPYDLYAARYAYELHLMDGNHDGLRDVCGRILPLWKKSTPLYGDLLGMYGFGLEETNLFSVAEKTARQALDINRHDAWASHCVVHCKEMTGQVQDGIKFMQQTEADWNDNQLQCHTYWHWALFLVENGDFESAMGILDNHILPFMNKNKTPFSHSDAASLCFRLQAEGHDVSDRWRQCYEEAKDHSSNIFWAFYDLHNVMTMTSFNKRAEADYLVESIKTFIKDDINDSIPVYRDVALPLAEAFQAWDDQDYDKAVEIMKPLRYKTYQVGGSNAQRDIFTLFAIHSALRSSKPENYKYARHLLYERRSLRGDTPMTSRLLQQAEKET